MASCCPPGSWPGAVEDASRELSGTVETLDSGLRVYVTGPATATKAVIVIHDVYGFAGARMKSVCDAVGADAEVLVAMADLYGNDDSIANYGGFSDEGKAFLKTHNYEKLSPQIAEAYSLLEARGATSVGMLGFCWGCWATFASCTDGRIKAGVCCHPALQLSQNLYDGPNEASQAALVQCPMLLMPAGNDPDLYKDGTLTDVINANGHEAEAIPFDDMEHGFVIRGDTSDEAVKRAVVKAVGHAVDFFKKHL